jgi:D-alanyl-lipoteichoic acid acyltransferase DltB (MBOAT superfamily)
MTLSAFLRDYLYVGLGGSRRGEPRRYANLLATMLLGGLWHGAGWTFVIWGAIHGVALAVCHFWHRLFGPPPESGGSLIGRVTARVLTLLLVVFGWVVFRADSLATAGTIMESMIGLNGFDLMVASERSLATLESLTLIAALTAVALFAPNSQELLRYDPDRAAENDSTWTTRLASYPVYGAALGCLFVMTLSQMSAVQAFLYFQF